MRTFIAFLRVLFGTPRRAVITMGVMAWCAIVEHFSPGFLGGVVYRMVHATVAPILCAVLRLVCEFGEPVLVGLILPIIIIWIGIRMIAGGFRRGR